MFSVKKTPSEIYSAALEYAGKHSGSSFVEATEAAVLVRLALRRHFPGQKFSVRTRCNSIDISWNNGPDERDVSQVTAPFAKARFDAWTDLKSYTSQYLSEDGVVTNEPRRGAVEVSLGSHWVFVNRKEVA